MQTPNIPENEPQRLTALKSYQLLDTLPEPDFDDITKIASQICGTPISLITLLDESRQWFKSKHGLEVSETPREQAFCAHAILTPDRPMVVKDSTKDPRFQNNPLVTGEPKVVFYAGVPLVAAEGYPLGTLCVIDQQPKELTQDQLATLQSLANQVVLQFELRKKIAELETSERKLKSVNEQLTKFAYILSHDIKAPVNNIGMLLEILQEDHGHLLDTDANEHVELMQECASNLKNLVENVVRYFRTTSQGLRQKDVVYLDELLQQLNTRMAKPVGAQLLWPSNLPNILAYKTPLELILQNLISNAIKYSDKPIPTVQVDFGKTADAYHFRVTDNGPGIPADQRHKVFDLFATLHIADRFGEKGTGLGLAIVKKFVEELGGEITLEPNAGEGCTFSFHIKR